MSAPCIFLVKECDFSKFTPISESAPTKLPDSSPALVIDMKSFEKTLGNLESPVDNVSPEFISSAIEFRILPSLGFFVCFFKTDNARSSESPAFNIPLKFFVKIICSLTLTFDKKSETEDDSVSKMLPLFSTIDMGINPRDLKSRAREKRS